MSDTSNENAERRPATSPLTDDELDAIKEQLLESIYADIGKSVVTKFLWLCGAICCAVFAWLVGAGHIKIGG